MREQTLCALAVTLAAGIAFAEEDTGAVASRTVAVDVTALPGEIFTRLNVLELEKQLVLRLVQEGFAVVSTNLDASIVVTFTAAPDELVITARRAAEERRRIVRTANEPVRAVQLGILHTTLDLVRALTAPQPPPQPEPPPKLELTQSTAPVSSPRAETPSPPPHAVLSAGLFTTWRGAGAVVPGLGLAARYRPDALPFAIELGLRGTTERTHDLRVSELITVIGVNHTWDTASWLQLSAGLGAGVLHHLYEFAQSPGDSGYLVDAVASLVVRAGIPITSWLTLSPTVLGDLVSRERAHHVDDQTAWEAKHWRASAALYLEISLL